MVRLLHDLRLRGIDYADGSEDGRSGIADSAVLDRAVELNRLLFLQDDDLLAEANQRQTAGMSFPRRRICSADQSVYRNMYPKFRTHLYFGQKQ